MAISLVMLLLIILLFTTLGGLGAIIMVSTVVLPILASVGVGPVTTTGIFLTGLSIGGILNVGNWAVYTQVLKLQVDEVQSFALIMFVLMFVIAVVYITIQLYKDGHDINFMKNRNISNRNCSNRISDLVWLWTNSRGSKWLSR
jgi:hypothetical protein